MRGSDHEKRIAMAWDENAQAWAAAVRERRIDSRIRITDQAILAAVRRRQPVRVLDVGCGEGWLARALAGDGIKVTGIDRSARLIEAAAEAGGGEFMRLDYLEMAAVLAPDFDLVVCNFSLLGERSGEAAIEAAAALLRPGGAVIIQTLHPGSGATDAESIDGWRPGSWVGCGGGFGRAAPWYFRTLASWLDLLRNAGFERTEHAEPSDPLSGRAVSLLLTASKSSNADRKHHHRTAADEAQT